jgi:hypothetical protein
VCRERPHPGAQLSLFDQDEGLRHQVFLTDTSSSGGGSAQFLEVRHRGHATVEDHPPRPEFHRQATTSLRLKIRYNTKTSESAGRATRRG